MGLKCRRSSLLSIGGCVTKAFLMAVVLINPVLSQEGQATTVQEKGPCHYDNDKCKPHSCQTLPDCNGCYRCQCLPGYINHDDTTCRHSSQIQKVALGRIQNTSETEDSSPEFKKYFPLICLGCGVVVMAVINFIISVCNPIKKKDVETGNKDQDHQSSDKDHKDTAVVKEQSRKQSEKKEQRRQSEKKEQVTIEDKKTTESNRVSSRASSASNQNTSPSSSDSNDEGTGGLTTDYDQ